MRDDAKNTALRERVLQIIEIAEKGDWVSRLYDVTMLGVILASCVPLVFKEFYTCFEYIDLVAVVFFVGDYWLRWATADLKLGKGRASFALYPLTPLALFDLAAILSVSLAILVSFQVLQFNGFNNAIRVFCMLRIARSFKLFRYSKSMSIIVEVIREQSMPLLAVGSLAVGYILTSAVVIFNVEPETFNNFFEAVYWATISLTTVGYGDIYAVTIPGRLVTMLSSLIGIAIVALPAGIVTAGYMDVLQNRRKNDLKIENDENAEG